MYVTVALGHWVYPAIGETILGMPDTAFWTLLLLVYAFFASTLPVTLLLQPRDYINAWQLFIAMALMVAGIVAAGSFGGMEIVAPAVQWSPEGAPPMWPFLFIIIACGAISGFHCLVASGTSSKQLACEPHALSVGFGSMLVESALAILVLIAVAAGIGLSGPGAWQQHYASWSVADGLAANLRAFVDGSANMVATLGLDRRLAVIVMGVFVASFAGTTLDTATRLQRYVIGELGNRIRLPAMNNRWVATTLAVVTAAALAFSTGWSGKGAQKLWPMFGALNQTLAALALLIVTVYLKRKGGLKFLVTGLPCLFMLVMTLWSMGILEARFIGQHMDYLRGVE
jgi:carbon starvation protein